MIFLIFIIIPILEITIFITVGSNIGVLNTIAIILITALLDLVGQIDTLIPSRS